MDAQPGIVDCTKPRRASLSSHVKGTARISGSRLPVTCTPLLTRYYTRRMGDAGPSTIRSRALKVGCGLASAPRTPRGFKERRRVVKPVPRQGGLRELPSDLRQPTTHVRRRNVSALRSPAARVGAASIPSSGCAKTLTDRFYSLLHRWPRTTSSLSTAESRSCHLPFHRFIYPARVSQLPLPTPRPLPRTALQVAC